MRENVLRDLASRAATDPGFIRQARRDLRGTLARHGIRLTNEEMSSVEGLRRRTSAMTDEELARALAGSLRGGSGTPPARRPELARLGARKAHTTRVANGSGSGSACENATPDRVKREPRAPEPVSDGTLL